MSFNNHSHTGRNHGANEKTAVQNMEAGGADLTKNNVLSYVKGRYGSGLTVYNNELSLGRMQSDPNNDVRTEVTRTGNNEMNISSLLN